jgi:membrane-bound lytic murein transglycosylase A
MAALCALLAGCATETEQPAITQGTTLRLTPTSFDALPGWKENDPAAALSALRRSCSNIDSMATGGLGYGGSAADWKNACDAIPATATPDQARAYFENLFTPVAISEGDRDEGLFTGYYEPELRASRLRSDTYLTPIYGVPSDMIKVDLGKFRDKYKGESITGRIDGNALLPYWARADIRKNGLPAAHILFYVDDPVAAFFLQVQGSGRARFTDGSVSRIAYAGQNGLAYTAIGKTLIEQGALKKEEVSLQTIKGWLEAHPDQRDAVMDSNASFVFFDEKPLDDPSLGAVGAEGVNLTPGASAAIDRKIHPLGVPLFIATTLPDGTPLNRVFIGQDTGGAIKGSMRADLFWGSGDEAEQRAGEMKQKGRMFVLLPKAVAASFGTGRELPLPPP